MPVSPNRTRRMVTYLEGAERDDQPKNLHTDAAAREIGYRGGLVYGSSVFAWGTRLIVDVLGEGWLRHGWTDLRILRPVYAGEALTFTVAEDPASPDAFVMSATGPEGKPRVTATVGLGEGAWVAGHHRSARFVPEPAPDPRPAISLATPAGRDLPTLEAEARDRLARLFHEATGRERGALRVDGREIQSPASLCGRMTWYVHAVWDYPGAALHVRSLVQHRGLLDIDTPVRVAGHLSAVYERNGNHYAETDGIISAADGREVALTRHTSIFHTAKRAQA